MWAILRLLAIGAAGAGLAYWLGIPAPFLTGPALFVTAAALAGLKGDFPPRLRDAIFIVIGVNMGASVTPEALATATRWPGSLVMLALAVLVIFLAGAWLMRRIFGMDLMSSLLTATPGHLSFVISLSSDVKADIPRVTMIQTMRVLSLTLAVPFLAPLISDGPLPAMPRMGAPMGLVPLAVLVVLSLGVGLVFQRLRVPAALLLGGMALSSAAHLAGLVEGGMPAALSVPAFVLMGTMIGTRFSGITPRMVAQSFTASMLLTGFAVLVSVIAAAIVAQVFDLPMLNVVIAFAPGGLETMIAMSVLLHANPTYVAAHHVFRLLFLTVVLPGIVAWARRRG